MELLGVELEEGDELVVVLELVDVHPHRSARVGGVGDEDVLGWAAVQLVYQPSIHCSKSEAAFIVCFFHPVVVAYEPEKFRGRRIRRKRQAAEICELIRAFSGFELTHDRGGTGVCPYDCIVEVLARLRVPDNGCFSLVRDSNDFDVRDGMALGFEIFACFFNALFDSRDQLRRIVLMPSD